MQAKPPSSQSNPAQPWHFFVVRVCGQKRRDFYMGRETTVWITIVRQLSFER
jgi:hypothetical protein